MLASLYFMVFVFTKKNNAWKDEKQKLTKHFIDKVCFTVNITWITWIPVWLDQATFKKV